MGQTALKAPFQLKPSYDEKKTTAYEGARSTRALRAPRDEIPQAELRAALVSGGEAPPIHAQRRAVRAQRRARSAARQGACLAPRRPPAPPARRPPVPTAAARRSPFASLPRPQRAMLTAPRRLLRLCSSTFRMGESASRLPRKEEALPGRSQSVPVADKHHVNGNRMVEPFPEGTRMAIFGMGCFWGAERKFWRQKGVYSTHVGYAGGYTPNPTYKEVCSELATQRLYEWYISQKTSALRNCSRSSGRIMTRHKECGKVMTLALSIVQPSTPFPRNRWKLP
ncbi:mitochondrial peptide methionine sulfoxide reductase isoform X2 [Phasianus colchicus]|uniref:mitochondrial peptide methionine sulfoxide reductase isoform X2 n=1 Tax=Phasianus colchicus TaxID=9054 RepID=UPI00129D3B12|nr:mitochondrial peptide methionine sulfoxide reductase isoform X2 [Phasianus colchicus]